VARVVIEHLTKVFPGPRGEAVRAVDDVSLAVEEGELLVLVGPSGCGKTTTLRLIAGLEDPDGGAVSIGGRIVNSVPPKDRDIAMVFQNHALYPHMTAAENIAFGLKLRGFARPEIAGRVKEAAEMLGLTDCLERRPDALSGGQRQRVALGRALVRRPGLFLFDEPLSNLDARMRLQMRAELSRLHRQLAATMILVTHDQIEAMTLGGRIAVMKDGALQQVAAPLDIYRRPINLFVAGFIGSPPMNFFHGALARRDNALLFEEHNGANARIPNGLVLRLETAAAARLADYAGRDVVLGVRPEDITQRLSPSDPPPGQTIEAAIEVIEPMGAETYLHLAGGGRPFVARIPATADVHINQRIPVVFDLRHAHFFDPATGNAIGL
jgi:multiple sugar transport system ATP-binding protein